MSCNDMNPLPLTYKSNILYQSLVVFNIPRNLESLKAITQKFKNLKLDYHSLLFSCTSVLDFPNSCHMCQLNYKELYNHEYCFLVKVSTDKCDEMMNKIKLINKENNIKLICEAKLNKDSVCPLMAQVQKEKFDFKEKLVEIIEHWFSDDEIFKHKDILVSMNNHGWVPLTVLETKLDEMIIIRAEEITEKLKLSSFLQIDPSNQFVRRINLQLPLSIEHSQIVLLDIPDMIKCTRQLQNYLQLESSKIEYFEYSIHAAIITMESRDSANLFVSEVIESGKMKAKLLVPDLIDEGGHVEYTESIKGSDVEKMLSNLSLKQTSVESVHVMRLAPSDLSYPFPPDFQPPSQEVIDKVVKQCNFYFSDENVLKDLFMLKKIKSNSGGWMDLRIVARFKLMVQFSDDSIDNVVYAMCFSDQVQISRDGTGLRRRLPLPEWDSSIYIRSLFLWHLPKFCDSYELLDQVFREEGRFAVRVSRYLRTDRAVPADLKKLAEKIPALGKMNCGVVEFDTRESMMAADDFIHMKWSSVKTLYLDTKVELPKPAVIIGKVSKSLPPPIPISSFADQRITSLQAGTLIDPRFWQVARLLSNKKRTEFKMFAVNKALAAEPKPKNGFNLKIAEFPPLNASKKPQKKKPLQSIGHENSQVRFFKKSKKTKKAKSKSIANVENSDPVLTVN